jgi:hypothetical protein
LIFDEVISGFRFGPCDLGSLYGVRPDLATFAKIIGGGMPVAAVAGRAGILGQAGREGGRRVAFSGGTYSAHPAAMLAAKMHLQHIVAHADEISRTLRWGADVAAIERAFAQDPGVQHRRRRARVGSRWPCRTSPGRPGPTGPDTVNDPALTDTGLRMWFQLACSRTHGSTAAARRLRPIRRRYCARGKGPRRRVKMGTSRSLRSG